MIIPLSFIVACISSCDLINVVSMVFAHARDQWTLSMLERLLGERNDVMFSRNSYVASTV